MTTGKNMEISHRSMVIVHELKELLKENVHDKF